MDTFETFVLHFFDFFGVGFINIFAPGCMLIILITWVIAYIYSKKNEHLVKIPNEYTGREAVYLRLRQHLFFSVTIYTELFIFILWYTAIAVSNIPESQQLSKEYLEEVHHVVIYFFLEMFACVLAIIFLKKYSDAKQKELEQNVA